MKSISLVDRIVISHISWSLKCWSSHLNLLSAIRNNWNLESSISRKESRVRRFRLVYELRLYTFCRRAVYKFVRNDIGHSSGCCTIGVRKEFESLCVLKSIVRRWKGRWGVLFEYVSVLLSYYWCEGVVYFNTKPLRVTLVEIISFRLLQREWGHKGAPWTRWVQVFFCFCLWKYNST